MITKFAKLKYDKMNMNLKLKVTMWACCCFGIVACEKETTPKPEPISPILKEIIIPSQSEVMPGQDVVIRGKGFSKNDKLYLENTEGVLEVTVKEVTDDFLRFGLPVEAGGNYKMKVERAEKTTVLDNELIVPFVVILENVELPNENIQRSAEVSIKGKGFEQGDVIELSAGFYPQGKVFEIVGEVVGEEIRFTLPEGVYGENEVAVVRGNRRTNLGKIGVTVRVGDELGGGVVFWTDQGGIHGLICNRTNIGTPTEPFGPSVALTQAAGTTKAIGQGRANTEKLLSHISAFRQNNANWNDKKTAAEWCSELEVTVGDDVYSDWFLPSLEELIELFNVKDLLAQKESVIPANNYWTSTEGDGDAAGWSAYYVNFYEATDVVIGNVDKEGWKIGIRAIRNF